MHYRNIAIFALAVFVCWSDSGMAGVTPEEAAQLKTVLTPTGAERAGNKDGTIPAWMGGYTTVSPDFVEGNSRPDPFADEAPLFTITAENYQRYADKLPEGQKALFQKFPDYRMAVYPTHRSAALPPRLYDEIAANALRAHAAADGIRYGVEGAVGGIPFPIPHNGGEVVWNHLLAFWGPAREDRIENYFIAADGTRQKTNDYMEIVDFPYYYPDATPDTFGHYYFERREVSSAPPDLAGRGYLVWNPTNAARDNVQSWQYLPREGRIRKAPLLSYDTPTPDGAGIESFDDYYVYSGSPDRYEFKLVGKQEMYIPYNNNRLHALPVDKVTGPHHVDPDAIRYELHRVWVVDGTLAEGKHHAVPHRRLYMDEDSWFAVYSDAWDDQGRLWKFSHGTMYLVPDLPAVVLGSEFIYDLIDGGYIYAFAFNDQTIQFKQTPPHKPSDFSAETLASIGQR
jgi:Protein of unknown function (DUF1329)